MLSLFEMLEAIWEGVLEIKDTLLEKKKWRYKILGGLFVGLTTMVVLYFIKKFYEIQGY